MFKNGRRFLPFSANAILVSNFTNFPKTRQRVLQRKIPFRHHYTGCYFESEISSANEGGVHQLIVKILASSQLSVNLIQTTLNTPCMALLAAGQAVLTILV